MLIWIQCPKTGLGGPAESACIRPCLDSGLVPRLLCLLERLVVRDGARRVYDLLLGDAILPDPVCNEPRESH